MKMGKNKDMHKHEMMEQMKYTCPMHPEIVQDHPGNCSKCGMALVPGEKPMMVENTEYTCPMHPEIIQDHPGSCPKCGMFLEPIGDVNNSED